MTPIEQLNLLHKRIGEVASTLGLEIDEDYAVKISDDQQVVSFKVHVLPGAFITPGDFDDEKYDEQFKDIIGEIL